MKQTELLQREYARRLNAAKEGIANGFTSKSAQKSVTESLGRAYSALNQMIQNHYLNSDRKDPEAQDLYYDLPDLHVWKQKHSDLVRRVFPAAAELVTQVEELVSLRSKAMSMEIAAKPTPEQAIRNKTQALISDSAIKPIFDTVTKSLAEFDSVRLARQIADLTERYNDYIVIIGAECGSSEYANRVGSKSFGTELIDAGFPLGFHALFAYRTLAEVTRRHTVDFEMECLSRDYKIAKQLVKLQVNSVAVCNVVSSVDGFNGTFKVETNRGNKIVEIDTIFAGGYNIQRLHNRVLVKVK